MNRIKRIATGIMGLLLTLALGSSAAFASTPATVSIPVSVTLTGDTPSRAAAFTFVLNPSTADTPKPASTTLTINGAGKSSFGPITFTTPGNYAYTLYQVKGNTTGYTYDTTVFTVNVQVTSTMQFTCLLQMLNYHVLLHNRF